MKNLTRKSKKTVITSLIVGILGVFSLFATTFAYFNSDIIKNGVSVNSQKIDVDFYGFKIVNDIAVEKFHYESGKINQSATIANEKLDDIYTLGKRAPVDYYFVVKKNVGSIDLDARVSFEISGLNDGGSNNENILSAYNFSYETLDASSILSPDNLSTDETIRNRITEYASTSALNTGEKDILNNLSSSSWLINDLRNENAILYRLTIELDDNAVLLGTDDFSINAKLSVGSEGSIISAGSTYYVTSQDDLIGLLETYEPGSNIYVTQGLVCYGDILFPRPVNLYVRSNTMQVFGNVIFSFAEHGDYLVSVQLGGGLDVLKSNNSGGNLIFDTPSAKLTLIGDNGKGVSGEANSYVEGDVVFGCNNKDGAFINQYLFQKYTGKFNTIADGGKYASLYVKNNSKLIIGEGTTVGKIYNYTDEDETILIENNGTIDSIDLSSMKEKETEINDPQIYIDNYTTIGSIKLPSWASKFNSSASSKQKVDANGQNIYNIPLYDVVEGTTYYARKQVGDTLLEIPAVFTNESGANFTDCKTDNMGNASYYCVAPDSTTPLFYYSIVNGTPILLESELTSNQHKQAKDGLGHTLPLTKVGALVYVAEGNTRIIHEYGSCDLRSSTDEIISGSATFVCRDDSNDDVEYRLLSDYVVLTGRDGDNISLRVLYENRTDENGNLVDLGALGTTLQILIEDFLSRDTDGLTTDNIVGLSVKCFVNKSLSTDDYAYIKSFDNLVSLDLSESKSVNYFTPDYAFQNLSNLSDIKLPQDISLGNYLFDGTNLNEIRTPATVETVAKNTFVGIEYLHQEGFTPFSKNFSVENLYLFVPDRNVWDQYINNAYADCDYYNHVFIEAQHYGNYFLRLDGDYAEFVCYISEYDEMDYDAESSGPFHFNFDTITVGERTYTITKYDVNALFNMYIYSDDPVEAYFEIDRQLEICDNAFSCWGISYMEFNCPVIVDSQGLYYGDYEALTFNDESYICDSGCSDNYYLTELTFNGKTEIESNAFAYCEELTNITFNDCHIATDAFINNYALTEIVCNGDFSVEEYAFRVNQKNKYSNIKYITQTDPEGIVELKTNSLTNLYCLQELKLEGSGYFGLNAINNDSNLFAITAPKITTLQGDAGSNLTNLRYIYMPSLVNFENGARFLNVPACFIEIGVPLVHAGQNIIPTSNSVVVFNTNTTTSSQQSSVIMAGYPSTTTSDWDTCGTKFIVSSQAQEFDTIVGAYCSRAVHTEVTADDYIFYTPASQKNLRFTYRNTYTNKDTYYTLPGNYIYYLTGEIDDDGVPKAAFVCDIYSYICPNPTSMEVHSIGDFIYGEGNVKVAKITTLLSNCLNGTTYWSGKSNVRMDLPRSIEIIEDRACVYNKCIYKLDLPEVESIGYAGFILCQNMAYVNAPKLKTINSSCFRGNTELLYVYAPSLVDVYGSYNFYEDYKLRVIEIGVPDRHQGFSNQDKTGVDGIQYCLIHTETYEGDLNAYTTANMNSSTAMGRYVIVDNSIYDKMFAYINSANNVTHGSRVINLGDVTADQVMQGKSAGCANSDALTLKYYDYETGKTVTVFDAEYLCYLDSDEDGNSGLTLLPHATDTITTATYTLPTELIAEGETYPTLGISAGCFSRVTFSNTTVRIPANYEKIGFGAFGTTNCKGLKKVIVEGDVSVGKSLFEANAVVTNIEFDGDIKGSDNTFYNCTALLSLSIYGDASFTGGQNFYGCIKLADFIAEGALELNIETTIGNNFYACSALKGNNGETGVFTFNSGTRLCVNDFASVNNALHTVRIKGDLVTTGQPFLQNSSQIKYLFVEGGATLANSSFINLKYLRYVEILGSGTIGSSTFQGDAALQSFFAPKITEFNTYTFNGCTALTYIYAPSCISYGWSGSTFNNCTGLKVLELGPQTMDEDFAFGAKKNLRLVFIHTENLDSDINILNSLSGGFNSTNLSDNCMFFMDNNNPELYDLYYRTLGDTYLSCTGHVTADCYVRLTSINGVDSNIVFPKYNDCAPIVNAPSLSKGLNLGYTNANNQFVSLFYANECFAFDETNDEAYTLYAAMDFGTNGTPSTLPLITGGNYLYSYDGINRDITFTKHLGNSFRDCKFYSTNLVMPDVDYVGKNAFYNQSGILSVTFNKDVTINYGFAKCTGLTSVTANGDIVVNNYAFDGCTNLVDLAFAEDVTLGAYAFNGCSKVKELINENPEATTRVERYAFKGTNIEKLILKGSGSFAEYAFYTDANKIKYLEVDKDFENEQYCFSATNLVYAYLPEATYFANYAFDGCASLEYIYAPMLTKIGPGSMNGWINIQTIEIGFILDRGTSTTTWNNCRASTLIVHSESVDPSMYGSFPGNNLNCSNSNAYTKLIVDEYLYPYYSGQAYQNYFFNVINTGSVHTNEYQRADEAQFGGKYLNLDNEIGYQYLYYVNENNEAIFLAFLHNRTFPMTGNYVMPSTLGDAPVTELAQYLFNTMDIGTSSAPLTSFTIPETVTKLGEGCFFAGGGYGKNKYITTLNAPGVKEISKWSFYNAKITNFDLYSAVNVGEQAFYNNTSMTQITFGPDIRTFSSNVFQNCNSFKYLYIDSHDCSPESIISGSLNSGFPGGANVYVHSDVKKALYSSSAVAGLAISRYLTYDIYYQQNNNSPKFYLAPLYEADGTTIRGYQLILFDLNGKSSIAIPSTVTPKDSVTNITYPTGKILEFTKYTFMNLNTTVTSITLPQYLEVFILNRDYNPTSIKTLSIDTSDRNFTPNYKVVDNVLYDKDQTTLIWYPKARTGTNILEPGAFQVPDTVKVIGNYAFEGNTKITYVLFPNTVQYVGYGAFQGCTSLETVIFNSGPTLDGYVFYGCSKLASIHFNYQGSSISDTYSTAKFIGDSIFVGCKSDYKIYVPDALLENYQNEFFYNADALPHLDTFSAIGQALRQLLDFLMKLIFGLFG